MIKYGQSAILILGVAGAVLPLSFSFAQTVPASASQPASAPLPETSPGNKGGSEPLTVALPLKSLLFSDDEIASIHSARAFYDKHRSGASTDGGIAEDDFLKNLEKIAAVKQSSAPTSFTYPQFFLSSIAYYSPSNWVIWIDNEKITQSSGVSASGLRVIGINKGKVTLEWKPERMDKIADVEGQSADNPIDVDFIGKKVVFSLKPNQTFTSYAMRVVEGKVAPVTVNIKEDAAAQILAEPASDGGSKPEE
jgi:hypothetical protein